MAAKDTRDTVRPVADDRTIRRHVVLASGITGMGVFLLFGALTLVALLYFWRAVPETKGRSLQELEQDLTVRAVG